MKRTGLRKTSWNAFKQILITWGAFGVCFGIFLLFKHFYYGSANYIPESVSLPELFIIICGLPFMIFGIVGTFSQKPVSLWGRKDKEEEDTNGETQ